MAAGKRNEPHNLQERKILWVGPVILDVHLYSSSVLEILRNLTQRGHSTCLIAMRSRNSFRIGNSKLRVISIPLRFVPLVSTIMFVILLFFFLPVYTFIFKPDFIVTTPDASILSLIPALITSKFSRARSKKVKFVLDVRSTPVEFKGVRDFLHRFWFSVSVLIAKKLFDGITIITPMMKKEICKTFTIPLKRVGVWSSGVSASLFNPENYDSERMEQRAKLGLTKRFVIFYHGVFSANRGLREAIEAMIKVKNVYPDVSLLLLGTGPEGQDLKALIQKRKMQEHVIIHDPVDFAKVPKYISISDVCIIPLPDHPYWRFQSPLKLLEYLAMGKVVIATDIPAHRAVIGKEKCGIYLSSIEPMEIAKAMKYAYLHKESLEEWGKIGREIIQEKYTWEKVAKDLENYLLLIDEKAD